MALRINGAPSLVSLRSTPLIARQTHGLATRQIGIFNRRLVPLCSSASSNESSSRVETEVKLDTVEESNTFRLKDSLAKQDSDEIKASLEHLKESGEYKLWNSYPSVSRRTTYIRELTSAGIKNAESLAIPSTRNDAAFLITVVGSTSVLAVLGGFLPGDWGFFVPYLVGGISLAVLAVGSVAPGLLQAFTDVFSQGFADTKDRVLRHEAAHFLVAYALGVPVTGYSLDLGKEHTNLMDAKLQKRLYQGTLDASALDRLAVVSMAGLTAEGLTYDKVVGQSADLFSLQRLINRSKPALSNDQQQNLTRWAVLYAATILKNRSAAYDALREAMAKGGSVFECIQAIEGKTLSE